MNISHIHEAHRKFLIQSVKFCGAIDLYIDVLGLDIKEIVMFKEEVYTTLYIVEHYKSFANSFILHNKGTMQKRIADLMRECVESTNYTQDIGKVIGVEERIKFEAFTFQGLEFQVTCKN